MMATGDGGFRLTVGRRDEREGGWQVGRDERYTLRSGADRDRGCLRNRVRVDDAGSG